MKKLAPVVLLAALAAALFVSCLAPLLLTGCVPPPGPVPPSPTASADAGGPAPPEAACSNLTALGCQEGGDHCAAGVAKLSALTNPPLACWAGAESKAAARACGQLACP